ncbi:MAG: type II toxin-antitoxin system Phd/YefM family antitoxin [Kiritimatiellia bacterium]
MSNISYLRNHLSEVLTCVKEGETVVVLDRKKPVACLTPYATAGDALTPRLKELQNQGLLAHGPSEKSPEMPRPLKLSTSVDVVRYLLDDREES